MRLSRAAVRRLALVYGLAAVPLVGIALIVLVTGLPGVAFYDDPTAYLDVPPYVGVLSLAGSLGWAVAVGATLLATLVLRRRGDGRHRMLAGAAAVSALLAVDDTLLIHDAWLGDRVGIPEPVTFVVYGIPVVWWLWRFRRHLIRSPELPLLVSASGFFAISLALDVTHLSDRSGLGFVEDGAKFLGIVGWAVTWVRVSLGALEGDRASAARSPAGMRR